jgi:hypothetical protein
MIGYARPAPTRSAFPMINALAAWRLGVALSLAGLILLIFAGWVILGVVLTLFGLSLLWGSTYD